MVDLTKLARHIHFPHPTKTIEVFEYLDNEPPNYLKPEPIWATYPWEPLNHMNHLTTWTNKTIVPFEPLNSWFSWVFEPLQPFEPWLTWTLSHLNPFTFELIQPFEAPEPSNYMSQTNSIVYQLY